MGCHRFGVPQELVLWLKNTFHVRHFIETGTNRAETSVWASDHFERVTTIEGHEPLFNAARKEYGRIRNVDFLLGDSRQHLRRLLPGLSDPVVFWLDAHWCGNETFGRSDECPVLGELEAINASSIDHFVLVDDARYFLAPPPAPHAADQWPDIWTVYAQLKGHKEDQYVAIYEDVIIGVPGLAKQKLVEYLRASWSLSAAPAPEPQPPSLLHRLKNILAR